MPEEQFSEADLAPSADELRAQRAYRIDRGAGAIATVAAGAALGLLLGSLHIPGRSDATHHSMLEPFIHLVSFGRSAPPALVALSLVALACELARGVFGGRAARHPLVRVRRVSTLGLAAVSAFSLIVMKPEFDRALGAAAAALLGATAGASDLIDRLHDRARLVRLAGGALALAVALLHALGPARPRPDDDSDDDAQAPLPPGGG